MAEQGSVLTPEIAAPALDYQTPQQPTRARQVVMLFAITLAVLTYIDRVCISQAATNIRQDLKLSEKQMGWVFSAFTVAYALFEIPAGRLGDRHGPRNILMKVVVMWSAFTALTGAAWNFVSMLVCRFLFGAGEAGCFPNLTKVFTIWFPTSERVRAQGILWLSARWGGAFTPAIVAFILAYMHWRLTFVIFGLLGVVWAVAFYIWFRDDPAKHPSVNAAELALMDGAKANAPGHGDVPWGKMLASPTVWLLWLQYFCMSYGWYFYITWLPTFLREAKGVTLEKSAILAGMPLFFGGIGSYVGGWLARNLAIKSGNVGRARRLVSCTGLVGAGVMLVVATRIQDPFMAMIAMGLASFSNDLAMASGWGACMDVGGCHAGSLSGSMNMMGNLGGAVGPVVVGYILAAGKASPDAPASLASWTTAFLVAAAVYIVGAVAWLFIDPVTPLEKAEVNATVLP